MAHLPQVLHKLFRDLVTWLDTSTHKRERQSSVGSRQDTGRAGVLAGAGSNVAGNGEGAVDVEERDDAALGSHRRGAGRAASVRATQRRAGAGKLQGKASSATRQGGGRGRRGGGEGGGEEAGAGGRGRGRGRGRGCSALSRPTAGPPPPGTCANRPTTTQQVVTPRPRAGRLG